LLQVEDALFAGLELWFMSSRKGYRQPGSHYCLSLSRGGAVSTVRLPPAGVWAIAAVALLAVAWSAAVTLYVAFHDDVMGAILARQAEMKAAYEDRLAEARARFDEAASRQLLERNSIKSKVDEVLSRQARLEQRGAIVVALAETEAHSLSRLARREAATPNPPDALSAIQALGPPTAAGASADDSARAYAPLPEPSVAPRTVKPHPIDESEDTLSALPSDAPFTTGSVKGAADNLAPSARLALVDGSIDQVEGAQTKALAAIDRAAERAASRDATIVAEAGLDPAKLSLRRVEGGVGGPHIPIDPNASGLDPALARVARDVATAERLKALLSFVPLRMPLSGDPSLTSSFGYRVDPFLGRLALHPGVDLAEAYGAEIHAAAAGRVTHAGPAGGYGIMVEIDHGNGLATRYAHMSEALVEEGEEVDKGAVLGRLGSTGRSTGPHLHYEVRVDGEPVDPERYLRAGAELTASE
jgi:murein DD-endopeptidase MepM/ murein hydrolase activator NlpD